MISAISHFCKYSVAHIIRRNKIFLWEINEKVRKTRKNQLTKMVSCDIVFKRDKILGLFFMLKKHVEVEKCVQRLHWHVLSASSATTIQLRKRRTILIEWKPRSIVDSARLTLCTKKPNKMEVDYGRFRRKAG